jgi:copper homeostasis protein
MLLEACVNSVQSAIEAERGGADRVELCENMADGGCTPGIGSVVILRKYLKTDLFVMIRPRGGDFLYSDVEFEIMKQDILRVKDAGADGVVFGILKPEGTIDRQRMKEMADLARPMKITCHRAFDLTSDPYQAMEDLISIGIDRILTSGQAENALVGAPLIKKLLAQSKRRISILAGGGIKENNIREVIAATGADEYHVYLTKSVSSAMSFIRGNVALGKTGHTEYESVIVDAEKINRVKNILNGNL